MKNKLHLRPYLRFVSAPSADAGGESSERAGRPVADGAAEKAQETDWAAEDPANGRSCRGRMRLG